MIESAVSLISFLFVFCPFIVIVVGKNSRQGNFHQAVCNLVRPKDFLGYLETPTKNPLDTPGENTKDLRGNVSDIREVNSLRARDFKELSRNVKWKLDSFGKIKMMPRAHSDGTFCMLGDVCKTFIKSSRAVSASFLLLCLEVVKNKRNFATSGYTDRK